MKALSSLLVFLLVLSCATPTVVEIKNPLDEQKTCDELEKSVAEAQKFKRDALFEKNNTGGNMARMMLFGQQWQQLFIIQIKQLEQPMTELIIFLK